jgi:hypothetical protein
MARIKSSGEAGKGGGAVLSGHFSRQLQSRRVLQIELPEFVICALEARLAEANAGASAADRCTLDHLIESELVNLISLRDVAELEIMVPGFTNAVHHWLLEVGD